MNMGIKLPRVSEGTQAVVFTWDINSKRKHIIIALSLLCNPVKHSQDHTHTHTPATKQRTRRMNKIQRQRRRMRTWENGEASQEHTLWPPKESEQSRKEEGGRMGLPPRGPDCLVSPKSPSTFLHTSWV